MSLRAGLALVLGLSCGCARLEQARGPKWSARPEPLELEQLAAEHGTRQALRILVFGDSGTGRKAQRLVAERMLQECRDRGGCDFALMTGDSIYPAGVNELQHAPPDEPFDRSFQQKFERPYGAFGRMDFWAVPGNHDWYGLRSVATLVRYTQQSARWRMPSHDYEIPRLPEWIHIYGLDTTSLMYGRESTQLERARSSLCDKPGWKLLFGHHPIYTSGAHGGPGGESSRMKLALLDPLIEPCGVQLYLSGHDHHQEHLSSPAFEQVVQGAAAKLDRLRRIKQRAPGVRSLTADSRLGFALVEATPQRLVLRFFGYDRPGVAGGAFHCRLFELDQFDDPAARSAPCP